jgi:hypothetical protein
MYQKHFGLTERPFSIAPDPRFLYMSQQHREALAHLLYGVGEGGGFVQLTGEVGTGKTTICRCLLEQLPGQVDMALILNPRVNAQELLASLCDELHIQYARDTTSIKVLTDLLNAYLLDSHSKGRRTVLMIDEAQNLSAEALEQVRLLTNLETTRSCRLSLSDSPNCAPCWRARSCASYRNALPPAIISSPSVARKQLPISGTVCRFVVPVSRSSAKAPSIWFTSSPPGCRV